jgi:hypothetical protein
MVQRFFAPEGMPDSALWTAQNLRCASSKVTQKWEWDYFSFLSVLQLLLEYVREMAVSLGLSAPPY